MSLSSSLDDTGADLRLSSSDDSPAEEVRSLLQHPNPRRDQRPSTHETGRVLWGFYCYSIASEVFSIVSLGLFLPVCLEQMARENGFNSPLYLERCPPSSATPVDGDEQTRCAVHLLGMWIDTASFSLFVYSGSVALQAITVISMSALADDPSTRYRLMSAFAAVGSVLTMAFVLLPPSSPLWPISALLALGANVSFGASLVCLNSYLPGLGRAAKETVDALEHLEEVTEALKGVRGSAATSDDLLMARQAWAKAQDEYVHSRALATSHISSRAVALGYASGISVLIALLVPVTIARGSTTALRFAIAGSGLCWALGSIPAFIWLRPTSSEKATPRRRSQRTFLATLGSSWIGLGRMIREWRQLPYTFVFLAAWFLLSDSFATLTSTAMLFGKTSLGMSTSALIVLALIAPGAGMCGALGFPRIQRAARWSNLRFLIILVGLACIIPIWGLLGLRQQWQMYLLAFFFGSIYGSFQSYARTCFSELVPSAQAARWFGLYSITDKSSSFLGPLLVALITNLTGQIRHGFFIILAMFVLALPILFLVNMDSGRTDAESFQRALLEVPPDEDGDGDSEGNEQA